MSSLQRFVLLLLFLLASCGEGGGPVAGSNEITIPGVGPNGIFDPAITTDGSGTLWMSYSEVRFSPASNKLLNVRTRLASSSDAGASWSDTGIINDFIDGTVPDPGGGMSWSYVWQQEVSRIEYDAADSDAGRRWKLLWHRYTDAYNPNSDSRVPIYENGWVAMKSAASPGGLATAAERKLFTGTWYNVVNNGPSEFPLAATVPTLNDCGTFTEPGVLAASDGVYVALDCIQDPGVANSMGKIILLKCTHTVSAAFASCTYLGNLLLDSEAADHGAYTGFSAPELVHAGSKDYLVVTPTNNGYRGCLIFEIADLTDATLVRSAGKAVIVKSLTNNYGGDHYGACGYHPAATASGIIDSSHHTNWNPQFRLFASKVNLP